MGFRRRQSYGGKGRRDKTAGQGAQGVRRIGYWLMVESLNGKYGLGIKG